MAGRSDRGYGFGNCGAVAWNVCTEEKVLDASRAGHSMYRSFAPLPPESNLLCGGLCIFCVGDEHKLLNERKRHGAPRSSASVNGTMYNGEGSGELRSTEQRKMLGDDFPGVDHAPEDSRLPHSVTRGAGRITILRAKATTTRSKLFLSRNCVIYRNPTGAYRSCYSWLQV